MLRSIFIFFIFLAPPPAEARSPTDSELSRIREVLAVMSSAWETGNPRELIETMPPALLSDFADQASLTIDELTSLILRQTEAEFNQIAALTYQFETSGLDVLGCEEHATVCTPYLFVPTNVRLETLKGILVETNGYSFVFRDEGHQWYLVDNDDDIKVLSKYYPQLLGVKFPSSPEVRIIE